jgi:hypothetical protein
VDNRNLKGLIQHRYGLLPNHRCNYNNVSSACFINAIAMNVEMELTLSPTTALVKHAMELAPMLVDLCEHQSM